MDHANYPHLSRIADSDEVWKHFKDFDHIFSQSSTCLPDASDNAELSEVAHELHGLAFEHFHLMLVFRFKIKEMARGIFAAVLAQNHIVLFNLARAFMEHSASLAYQDQALHKAIDEIQTKQNTDLIRNSIATHRDVIRRLYYGGERSPIQVKPVHVNDLLKTLDKTYENASLDYGSLCEFVHPNYGSNILVSSGVLASGEIGARSGLLLPETGLARNVIEKCADIGSQLVLSSTSSLAKIGNWVMIASRRDVKLSQLFSLRSAHTGDGKTQETAIFFHKARTHHEAIEAFYKHIQDEGLEMQERRLAGIDGSFAFDVVTTNRGTLWVKYRMPE